MPKAVSMVRQATATAAAFVGAIAQLIVDTGANVIRVHDGVTPGGFPQLGASNNLSDLPNKVLARTNLGALGISNNLSDLSSASTARTNLGCLAITSNLSDLNNPATARTNLGLGSVATYNASTGSGGSVAAAVKSGGVIANRIVSFLTTDGSIQDSGYGIGDLCIRANNLSDLTSVATARANLGLGTAALVNTGVSGGTIPLLNASTNIWSGANIFTGVNNLRYDAGDASSHPVLYIDGTQSGPGAGRIGLSTSGPSGTLRDGEIWLVYA